MTLERHIVDTIKEWQIKIGSLNSDMRLYYPKESLCDYMHMKNDVENETLKEYIKEYLSNYADYLGEIAVSYDKDRFCIFVDKSGCEYVERIVPSPVFLAKFLEVLKLQSMDGICELFCEYAKQHGTTVCSEKESAGLGTVLYFKDELVEPYVYCIEQNEFGITYHRFTRDDFDSL